MSDISQISLGGVDYNIKDSNARSNIASTNNKITTLSNKFNMRLASFISVHEFGAMGNGIADDTQAIKNAVNYCKTNKCKLIFPNKKYLISDTIDMRYIDVDIQGEISIAHNGIGLIVGDSSITSLPRIVNINYISHKNYVDGDISVRIMGLSNGDITIRRATFVQLYADGDDSTAEHIAYSTFNIGTCEYLQITDKPGTSKWGWINENTFFNCRVMNRFSIEGNTYAHDSNVFYKPCFELCDVYLSKCNLNKFYDVRSESTSDNKFTLTLDENTSNNYISLGLYYHFPYLIDSQFNITDNGHSNIITCEELNSLKVIPFLDVNSNTVKKGLYEIYKDVSINSEDNNLLTLSGGKYGKILSNTIIPVNEIKYIVGKADNSFEWYITPLDENQEVMFNNPLTVYGLTEQNGTANGMYLYGLSNFVAISIVDPNVQYLKITIDKGAATENDIIFHNLSLIAYYDPRNESGAIELSNYLKSNKLDLNTTSPQTVKGKITFQDEITASKVFSKGNQVLTKVNANVESTTGSTASFTSSISDGIETLTLRLPNFSTGGGGGTTLEGLEASVEELNYMSGVTSNVQKQLNTKATRRHASTTVDYGLGDATKFGHVKLSDDIPTTIPEYSNGIAASQKALSTAYYELLNKPKVTYLVDSTSTVGIQGTYSITEGEFSDYDLLIIQISGSANSSYIWAPCTIITTSNKFITNTSIAVNGFYVYNNNGVNHIIYLKYLNSTSCQIIDRINGATGGMPNNLYPTSLSIIGVKL